jgi:hypothetical protein
LTLRSRGVEESKRGNPSQGSCEGICGEQKGSRKGAKYAKIAKKRNEFHLAFLGRNRGVFRIPC